MILMKILIGYPCPVTCKVFEMFISHLSDYEVYTTHTIEETIDKISESDYQLIVIQAEWLLSSIVLLQWQVLNIATAKTPILALTTDFDVKDRMLCSEYGINVYHQLPMSLKEFKKITGSFVQLRELSRNH